MVFLEAAGSRQACLGEAGTTKGEAVWELDTPLELLPETSKRTGYPDLSPPSTLPLRAPPLVS